MITYDLKIRVNYKDTDKMGIVHHSNYIVYYEMARVAALREWGLSYFEMSNEVSSRQSWRWAVSISNRHISTMC